MPPKRKKSATQRQPTKCTRRELANESSSPGRRQESLTNSRQTRQSSRTRNRQAENTDSQSRSSNQIPTSSTSSSSILLATPTISPPAPANSSTQSTGTLAPHQVLCQLPNVLLQLSDTIKTNAPLSHNTESTPMLIIPYQRLMMTPAMPCQRRQLNDSSPIHQ